MSIELEVNDLTPIELLSDDSDFVGLSLSEVIEGGGGSALTDDVKQALLAVIQNVAFINDDGQDYYDALYAALYPPVNLDHITAQYTQSGTVYPTTSLDSLKADLVVKAFYTDGTKETVPSTDYTLTGTLTAGTSQVTVTYGGQTATFNVTVTAKNLTSISAVYTQSGTVYDTDSLDSLKTDLVVTAHYSDSSTETVASTDYTLSGTLTAGTSSITVSYGGKTTTFNVTVSEIVLYPLPDIAYAKAGSGVWASVSDGNHIKTYTDSNSRGPYIYKDGTMATYAATNRGVMFQIPAGASYEIKIKNIVATGNTDASNVLYFRLCKSDGDAAGIDVNIPTIGDSTPADATASGTLENATDIYSVYGKLYRSVTIDYDVEVRINGVRYI